MSDIPIWLLVAQALTVGLLGAVEFWRLARFLADGGRPAPEDAGSLLFALTMIALGALLALALTALAPWARITLWRSVVFGAGVAMALLGIALRAYAVRALGRYFTLTVQVRQGHQLIETGPYRYVRHPSYSGALLSLLGLGLTLLNLASLATLMLCALVGIGYRVHVEERALAARLGEPWAHYRQRTKRFVPGVW